MAPGTSVLEAEADRVPDRDDDEDGDQHADAVCDSRPARTADRAIGSERSRSMTPLLRSCASAIAVAKVANAAVWPMMPGIRKLTYPPVLAPWMAPPNT